MRLQELKRLQKQKSKQNIAGVKGKGQGKTQQLTHPPLAVGSTAPSLKGSSSHCANSKLPRVAILLPARGYRSYSRANWGAILKLEYDGPLEFIFIIEDAEDVAYSMVSNLAASVQHPEKTSRVIFSGHAATSSQKIHNLVAGIHAAHPTAAYILCLDDDVQPHTFFLSSLVQDMEASKDLRFATGYPFDVPPPPTQPLLSSNFGPAGPAIDTTILSYAALSYHLPLVIAFSLRSRTHFVWGGCMMFRGDDLRGDVLGVLAAWQDGGYSDDLIVAARATQLGLHVFCPSYAIFPQWVDGDVSPRRYWNYLRRQLFVLDTYSSDHNKRTNHIMAFLHCYLSWGFAIPAATATALTLSGILLWILSSLSRMAPEPTQTIGTNTPSMMDVISRSTLLSTVLFISAWVYTALGLRWMTGVVLDLLGELNAELAPGELRRRFSWWKLWAGFWLAHAVLPLCMAYTFVTKHIEWSGVVYRRRQGKIVKVLR